MKTSGIVKDNGGRVWARFHEAQERYGAIVANWENVAMPEDARLAFQEFETRVSAQLFSLIEDLEAQLRFFDLWVVWDGEEKPVKVWDVQFSQTSVSFKITPSSS